MQTLIKLSELGNYPVLICIPCNGKEFVGIGIKPDVVVKKTIKDLLDGKDAAKNKALELLH